MEKETTIPEITIWDLAPYLPHKPLMYFGELCGMPMIYPVLGFAGRSIYTFTNGEDPEDGYCSMSLENYKYHRLVLRPLSDICKSITIGEETFIPMERLKTEFLGLEYDLKFYIDGSYFYASRNGIHCVIPQGKMIQRLLEWHLDIFSLIEAGSAISLNDLPKNSDEPS